jgi:SAM-dependent methyltransferase
MQGKGTKMHGAHETDDEQARVWNGAGGRGWVEMQDVLDRLFEPLEHLLVEAVCSGPAGRVLDVGCGTGGTTLAIARRLDTGGACTGIDISEPMVAAARSRAERQRVRARFVRGDAQRHRFAPASLDMIVSRFGVMFFDDFIDAFANLRAAARQGGALRFIAWRSATENPFMTTAERAAAPLVTIPAREPGAPGQFAFADEPRVRAILQQSGWSGIDVQPIDVACTLPEKDLLGYLTRLGPLGRTLADMDASTRTRVAAAVRPAFEPYEDGGEVRFTAACWMVGAHA